MDISSKINSITKFMSDVKADPLKQEETKAMILNIIENNKDSIVPFLKYALSELRKSFKGGENEGKTFIFTEQEGQMILCIAKKGAIKKMELNEDEILLFTDSELIKAAENDTLGDFLNI